jgi:hypothetical protein
MCSRACYSPVSGAVDLVVPAVSPPWEEPYRRRRGMDDSAGLSWRVTFLVFVVLLLGPFRGFLWDMYRLWAASGDDDDDADYLIETD